MPTQSKIIQNKGGVNIGSPYALPGYEYDPVTDKFTDLSNGKVFDSSGNAKIEPNKSVTVTENGESRITPSATYDGLAQVSLNVEVPVPVLEANKAASIDVSTYTEPVEVTPTQGKDGMEKVTVSLSNIPTVETTKQATIDVSTYDPVNKPVITPTAGKQSMAEVEITLNNIPSGSAGNVYCDSNAPTENDVVPEGEYVGTTIFDPDLGNRVFIIVGDGVKTVSQLMTEIAGSGYSWTYITTCTNVIVNEESQPVGKLHLYYGYAG